MTDQAATVTGAQAPAIGTKAARWRTEDWVAVLRGFAVIAAVVIAFQLKLVDLRNYTVSNFRWTTESQIAGWTPGWIDQLNVVATEAEARGQKNVAELSKALVGALNGKDRKAIEGAAA